jgi:mRNA-degrading endonuclease RelE of RelBE toxin-antitoxin system
VSIVKTTVSTIEKEDSEMAFRITITQDAEAQLLGLSVRERRNLEAAILARLVDRPTTTTKAIKRLRANPVAEFELRAGDLRVLYNVEGEEVVLLIVGRKVGNTLIVEGEEFHAHQDDPPESPGGGPAGDAE